MPDPSRLLQTRWATTLLRKQGNNWQATNGNRHAGHQLVSWLPKRNAPSLALLPPSLHCRKYTAPTQQNNLIFSEGDVPPLPFWTAAASRQGFDGLTGEECLTAARRYCALAAQGVSTWKGKLGRDHGISPYLLHSIGSMLISGPPGPSWRLGLHVLGTASDLSYSASSLTLMRLLSRASPEQASRLLSQNAFRDAELRFKKLVSEGTDPDALTLQGILLAAKGDENSALRAFAKAVLAYEKKASSKTTAAVEHSVGALSGESARPAEERRLAGRPFRWTWEASCYVGSGRILLKQGKLEEAREAFTVAAEELDTPEGYLELGKMLPKDDPAREVYLTTAAISGNKEASLSLGELSLQKAEELGTEDKTAKAAKEHGKRAAEWFAIAGEQKRGEEARLA